MANWSDIALATIPAAPLAAAIWCGTVAQVVRRTTAHRPVVLAFALSLVAAAYVLCVVVPGSVVDHSAADTPAAHSQTTPIEASDKNLVKPVSLIASETPASATSSATGEPHGPAHKAYIFEVYRWMSVGGLTVDIVLRADAMTALMLVMVNFVSLLVAIFASSYMHGDKGYPRFFGAMALFVFSMNMLVLAGNFIEVFIFWEAVGLCSYLLIGHWYHKPSAAAAARKAFVVNRIGDFGLMTAIFLIYRTFGSVDFETVLDPARLAELAAAQPGLITTIALLLLLGAIGKSAQFPLHVWLPDAMEGPTPVSALIHAATMVTAGVYLIARTTPIFVHSPTAQLVVAGVGATTALVAAVTALCQYDLKRVLAYSTVSQLGYMFMALGAAAASPALAAHAETFAMFHLLTHAFFKAVLFLAAGSVMHAMGDVIDMRRFSGLKKALPITHITFLCGALALAGFPLLSGFWSKDEILAVVWEATQTGDYKTYFYLILGVGLLTSLLTAFYTFRAYYLTFHGPERFPEEAGHHPHDASPAMAIPLYILAALAVVAGLILGPTHIYAHYIEMTPNFPTAAPAGMNVGMMILSTVLALGGIGLAYSIYGKATRPEYSDARPLSLWENVSLNGLYLDQLYGALIARPMATLSAVCEFVDRMILDKIVDAVGLIPIIAGGMIRPLQNGLVSSYAAVMLLGVIVALASVLRAIASVT